MSDADSGSGITLTIKHDKGYEAPWAVIRGNTADEARERLIAFAGIEDADFEGKSLLDVFLEVDKMAKGQYQASSQLGGKVIRSQRSASPKSASEGTEAGEESDEDPIVTAIKNVQTVDDLKRLWAENQEAFKDEALMASWKARGKELSNK